MNMMNYIQKKNKNMPYVYLQINYSKEVLGAFYIFIPNFYHYVPI